MKLKIHVGVYLVIHTCMYSLYFTSSLISKLFFFVNYQEIKVMKVAADNEGAEHGCRELHHLSRQQLEMLYIAKTRQVQELEEEVKRTHREEEKKVCFIVYTHLP